MASSHPQLNLALLLKNVEHLGCEYAERYLGDWRNNASTLQDNWFEALHFVFERTFMRGRRDELSNEYLCYTVDRLRTLLMPDNDLDKAFERVLKYNKSGLLDVNTILDFKKRHGMVGTKNSITHPSFQVEIAGTNEFVRFLTSKADVTVVWPDPYSAPKQYPKNIRLSNDMDLMMVMDTLRLLCRPECRNIYCCLMRQIESDGLKTAYRTLFELHGVADKLASMTIRDLGILHPNLISADFEVVFPVDTWVRKVATHLGCLAKTDPEIKRYFIRECEQHGVNVILFVAGMWYLGANSLTVLVREYLGRHPLGDIAEGGG
jgi:hypothetical protein